MLKITKFNISLKYFFLIKLRKLFINNKFIVLFKSNDNNKLLNFKYYLMTKGIESISFTSNSLKSLCFFEHFKFMGDLKLCVFCNSEESFFFILKNPYILKYMGFCFKLNFSSFFKLENLNDLYLNYKINYILIKLQILCKLIKFKIIYFINKLYVSNILNLN